MREEDENKAGVLHLILHLMHPQVYIRLALMAACTLVGISSATHAADEIEQRRQFVESRQGKTATGPERILVLDQEQKPIADIPILVLVENYAQKNPDGGYLRRSTVKSGLDGIAVITPGTYHALTIGLPDNGYPASVLKPDFQGMPQQVSIDARVGKRRVPDPTVAAKYGVSAVFTLQRLPPVRDMLGATAQITLTPDRTPCEASLIITNGKWSAQHPAPDPDVQILVWRDPEVSIGRMV